MCSVISLVVMWNASIYSKVYDSSAMLIPTYCLGTFCYCREDEVHSKEGFH